MSGLPSNLSNPPIELAKKVLSALGLEALVHHVLGARSTTFRVVIFKLLYFQLRM